MASGSLSLSFGALLIMLTNGRNTNTMKVFDGAAKWKDRLKHLELQLLYIMETLILGKWKKCFQFLGLGLPQVKNKGTHLCKGCTYNMVLDSSDEGSTRKMSWLRRGHFTYLIINVKFVSKNKSNNKNVKGSWVRLLDMTVQENILRYMAILWRIILCNKTHRVWMEVRVVKDLEENSTF